MTRTAWKQFERFIARRWGGERVPVTGRTRGYAPDVAHTSFAIEAKTKAIVPLWIWTAIDQAVKAMQWGEKRDGVSRLPVVVVHQDRMPYSSSLVILRMTDFEAAMGVTVPVEISEGGTDE